jgi:hypothetical protein
MSYTLLNTREDLQNKCPAPFRLPLENTLLLLLGIASDPDRNDEDEHHEDAKFPKLIATQQADDRKARQGKEAESIAEDVSCL